MSELVRMRIEGMTCATCEASVAGELEKVGARDVHVDHRRSEAVFTAPTASDLGPFRDAVSRAGYRPLSDEVSAADPRFDSVQNIRKGGRQGWIGTLALVALPVICCGLPLLVAALVATGAGAWLLAYGSLLAVPVLGLGDGDEKSSDHGYFAFR